MRVVFINGPNLNLLGQREPEVYGVKTLREIEEELRELAKKHDVELCFFQSNSEGAIIDFFQSEFEKADVFILNAAAYTHTSLALADTVRACPKPVIELHISNIYAREAVRRESLLAPYVKGIVAGFGSAGYRIAFLAALQLT